MISRVWDVCVVVLIYFFMIASVDAEELVIDLDAGNYEILKTTEGFQEIRMENFGNLLTPGKPMLPGKTFLIAIPPGAEVTSIDVMGDRKFELKGNYKIIPAPFVFPMDNREDLVKEAREVYRKNKTSCYSSNHFYPDKVGWYAGKGALGKYNFVKVTYTPFSYNPKSGKLIFSPRAHITINYSIPSSVNIQFDKFDMSQADNFHDNKAANIFVNYKYIKKWYPQQLKLNSLMQTYNYVIITTDELQNSVSSLVSWKVNIGFSVNVVTINWINNNYTGSDLPQKIRNFLIDKYGEWGIEYVLLVGDVNDIPMRTCYPRANSSTSATPTDYYYADLTGDWNSDGDSRYGEYGQDNVDWVPEVIVGRIPWSNASTVSQICQKLVNFEGDKGSWKQNALLLGAMSNYANEDNSGYSRTDGASLMEMNKNLVQNSGGNSTTMYEKVGVSPNTNTCSAPLTHSNILNSWSSGQYGMVNWWAHGSSSSAYRKWWASDDDDNVPESSNPNEISWEAMVSNNDCASLNDSYASIIFACSCNNGYPEYSNLGKSMIKRGSAGIVASSRMSWYSIGWKHQNHGGNASLDYYFFYYLINNDDRVGDALFNSKVYYSTHFMFSSWGWICWQNMFDFNLYGDPSLCRLGLSPTPTSFNISGNINYNVSALPVSNIELNLSGNSSNTQAANGSGFYQFSTLQAGGNYTITPKHNSQIPGNSILGYDAALAARIALGLDSDETEEQRIAADVDKNGSVQMYDASLIAQYAVGLFNPDSKVGEWVFSPENRIYQPLAYEYANQNFTAIILGDVDGNWSETNLLAKDLHSVNLYFKLSDEEVLAGNEYILPITVEDNYDILSFDISLTYNPKLLKYIGMDKDREIEDFQVFVNKSVSGKLVLTAFSIHEVKKSGILLKFIFDVIGKDGDSGNIELECFRINDEPAFCATSIIKVGKNGLKEMPRQFALFQNYPNPFNPETNIKYQLPENEHVSILIFNMLGQKIRTLIDEKRNAGYYNIIWDGNDDSGKQVSSGLYLYKIQAGGFINIKKMAMMK